MRLKSYYSGTVEGAIAQARKELGDDVMLVHSRRTAPEFAHLGAYEVVFAIACGVAVKPPAAADAAEPGHQAPPPAPKPGLSPSSFAFSDFRRELTQLAVSLEDSAEGIPLDSVSRLLTEQGVDSELIFELLREVKRHVMNGGMNEEKLLALLVHEMESRIRVEASMTESGPLAKVVALIGPPGCGKTTTLIKLAARFGLSSPRPCLLISADNFRIGSSDQLRSYAAILGVGFDTAVTPVALSQMIEEHKNKSLILIDTPGLSNAELDDYDEWARFFSSREDIEKHLILSASMKNADLSYVVDRYRMFGPDKLLFTKLDETATQGAIWNEAARTGLPLSYWTTGQRIPEDLAEASKSELLDAMFKQDRKPRSAAAGM